MGYDVILSVGFIDSGLFFLLLEPFVMLLIKSSHSLLLKVFGGGYPSIQLCMLSLLSASEIMVEGSDSSSNSSKSVLPTSSSSYDKSVSCSDPDYEEEKLKILAGDRLPLPELADLMPWGTEVYEEV